MQVAHLLLGEIKTERGRLNQLATRREEELGDLTSFTNALTTVTKEMLTNMSNVSQQMLTDMRGVAQEMSNAATELRTATMGIEQAIREGADVLRNLEQPIGQVVVGQQQVLHDMAETLRLQRESSQDVKQLVQDQRQWGKELTDAIDDFTVATRPVGQFPTKIGEFITKLEGLVGRLEQEHRALANLSQMSVNSASTLGDALKEIRNSAADMRALATDFQTMLNLQRESPDLIRAGLQAVIRDHANAAANVAQGGNQLVAAANTMQQAGQWLYQAASRLNGHTGP